MTTYKKSSLKTKLITGSVVSLLGVGAIGYGLSSIDSTGNTNVPVKDRSSEVQTTEVQPTEEETTEAPTPRSTSRRPPIKKPVTPTAKPSPKPTATEVYFASCTDVWNSGDPDGLRRGEPGYRPGLDQDGDGTACENRG